MKLFHIAATLLLLPLPQVGNNPPVPPSWQQHPGQSPSPTTHDTGPTEEPAERMRREQAQKFTLAQQEKARAEAAQLLELATQLKHQIDGVGSSTLSVEAARAPATADAIIKLAKSIKSKARGM